MNPEFTLAGPDSSSPRFALEISNDDGTQVFAITPDGKVFSKGREIQGDEDFRSSFRDLSDLIRGVAYSELDRILRVLSKRDRLNLLQTFCPRCGSITDGGVCHCDK